MWKKVEYSKKKIERAGRRIVDPSISDTERAECLEIIDNWRAAHAYPMNTFAVNLRRQVADIDGAIVAQRLKRLDTICDKLKRHSQMSLYRMQDLGGCRVIVPTITDVYMVKERLEKSRIRHEKADQKDYIKEPNPKTGYRGIHLIYRYKSERSKDYNGLRTEIQIRTKLQHLWATSVETVGLFTGEGLKFSQGSDEWLEFFRLVSELFAIEESLEPEKYTAEYKEILAAKIMNLDIKLDAIHKMQTIGVFSTRVGHINHNNVNGYYILILNKEKGNLTIKQYNGNVKGLNDATDEYNRLELFNRKKKVDIVLVSAQSYEMLVNAYPNYFADIREFLLTMLNIMKRYVEEANQERESETLGV